MFCRVTEAEEQRVSGRAGAGRLELSCRVLASRSGRGETRAALQDNSEQEQIGAEEVERATGRLGAARRGVATEAWKRRRGEMR